MNYYPLNNDIESQQRSSPNVRKSIIAVALGLAIVGLFNFNTIAAQFRLNQMSLATPAIVCDANNNCVIKPDTD
jgi:hypothetical protein